jgi:murein DD-endopeptidase MepM/ murein hydrolase activator NlpD
MLRRLMFIALAVSLVLAVRPAAAQSAGPIYIVQPGDTLSSIASRFNVSINELMTANDISNPNLLSAGQELVIPGLEGVSGVLDTELINFGDSFRGLVRRTQVPVPLLRKLNRLVSPTEFYVGASMIIPKEQDHSDLTNRISPRKGETLLELAAGQNTDPWTVLSLNDLAGTWAALPQDVLYAPGNTSTRAASGLPSAFVDAQIPTLPLKQGGTAEIIVQPASGVSLGGILVERSLHFFPLSDGRMVALQGVYALLDPGLYPLRLDATLSDGTRQSFEQMVLVVSGNYPEDPLLVVSADTIDPAVTDPELNEVIGITTPATADKLWAGQFTSPAIQYAASTYFTSRFGNRRTYLGQGTKLEITGFHTGLDFGGGTGLPISAPAAGRVVFTGPLTVRGNATILDHGWGVYSGFWHQSEFKVQVGDLVQQGQTIGLVGGTGRVTGAHLHWEIWVNGVQVDPLDWLNETYP